MSVQRSVALAPAKLNLGLEVLGRRDDGYHEIVSILQTISLFDSFNWSSRGEPFTYEPPSSVDPASDLVARALGSADDSSRWTGTLSLRKSIPASAGLGGGSSDAALALRIAHPDRPLPEVEAMAADLGSDVPFFLRSGTALATGTGTTLQPLPTPSIWFVVLTPDVLIPSKTRTMYSSLVPEDFTDGSTVRRLATEIHHGTVRLPPPNAFTRVLLEFPAARVAWNAFERAGADWVGVSGAGPSLYFATGSFPHARAIARRIPETIGAVYIGRALAAQHSDVGAKNLADRIRRASRAR